MNLSQLQSLLALADTGSFTEAAEQVSLTQSAVSHSLAALERELGVTLLERSRKGVTALTPVGQQILPHVRAMLRHAEAIVHEARAAQGRITGKVRLGSIHSVVPPPVLSSLLARFQRQYPGVEVVLFDGTLREAGEWIEHNIVDVSFVVLPAPGAVSTPIANDELCVLVPSDHRLARHGEVSPEELRREGFIMEKNQCTLRLMERAGFELGAGAPGVRFQASDSATIVAMVREKLGLTLMPRQMLPAKPEGVVALRLAPPVPLPIGLAYKERTALPRAVQLFVETATAWAKEQAHAPGAEAQGASAAA